MTPSRQIVKRLCNHRASFTQSLLMGNISSLPVALPRCFLSNLYFIFVINVSIAHCACEFACQNESLSW